MVDLCVNKTVDEIKNIFTDSVFEDIGLSDIKMVDPKEKEDGFSKEILGLSTLLNFRFK